MAFSQKFLRSYLEPHHLFAASRNIPLPERSSFLREFLQELYGPLPPHIMEKYLQLNNLIQSGNMEKYQEGMDRFWKGEIFRNQLTEGKYLLNQQYGNDISCYDISEIIYRDIVIEKNGVHEIRETGHTLKSLSSNGFGFLFHAGNFTIKYSTPFIDVWDFANDPKKNLLKLHEINESQYLILAENGFYTISLKKEGEKRYEIESLFESSFSLAAEIIGKGDFFIVKSKEGNSLFLFNIRELTLTKIRDHQPGESVKFHPEINTVSILEKNGELTLLNISEDGRSFNVSPLISRYSFVCLVLYHGERHQDFLAAWNADLSRWQKVPDISDDSLILDIPRMEESPYPQPLNLHPAKVIVKRDGETVTLLQHVE